MIHGKLKCPNCQQELELSATKAPAMQSRRETVPESPTDDIGVLLSQIDDDSLTGKNREFVIQTRERYEQYGKRTRMSEKQMSWLQSIASGEADEW